MCGGRWRHNIMIQIVTTNNCWLKKRSHYDKNVCRNRSVLNHGCNAAFWVNKSLPVVATHRALFAFDVTTILPLLLRWWRLIIIQVFGSSWNYHLLVALTCFACLLRAASRLRWASARVSTCLPRNRNASCRMIKNQRGCPWKLIKHQRGGLGI